MGRSLVAVLLLCLTTSIAEAKPQAPAWTTRLADAVARLDAETPGELGVHVKSLGDAAEVSYRARRPWYLASTVKVPVAVATMQLVREGKLSLARELTLRRSDFVDGTGALNWKEPGERFTVGYALEKMLTESDSTAADVLIRLVGVDELNRRMAAFGFGPLTTLLQVRHDAWSELHPKARELSNMDFFDLKKAKEPAEKLQVLERKVGVGEGTLRAASIDDAFERYYARGRNSAPLDGYARFLERLVRGKLLTPAHTRLVLGYMERMVTGEKRIKAGLASVRPDLKFAQKTGTQHRRICNVGVLRPASVPVTAAPGRATVVTACLEKFDDPAQAEATLARLGQILARELPQG